MKIEIVSQSIHYYKVQEHTHPQKSHKHLPSVIIEPRGGHRHSRAPCLCIPQRRSRRGLANDACGGNGDETECCSVKTDFANEIVHITQRGAAVDR